MSTGNNGHLGEITISGTHYDIGAQLGRHAADLFHSYTVGGEVWTRVMDWRADSRVMRMRKMVEDRFPAYCQEIRGLADALSLPYDDMVLWHFRGDVWEMPAEGCTTVQIPGKTPVIAHNEDGDGGQLNRCAIAHVRPEGGTAFSSFIYPGSLPGQAFAVTKKGIVSTINHIGAHNAGAGLPRMMLGRAILDCDRLDDAVHLLQTAARSGAFHVTLAQAGDERLFGVEFTHLNCSVRKIEHTQCHSNHLVHDGIADEPQEISSSSRTRLRQGSALVAQAKHIDPLNVLWDKSDPEEPIYRHLPGDPYPTLATAVFHVGAKSVEWSVYDRPGEPPCFTTQKS
jgi:predicted choloylglycine hydrolase